MVREYLIIISQIFESYKFVFTARAASTSNVPWVVPAEYASQCVNLEYNSADSRVVSVQR